MADSNGGLVFSIEEYQGRLDRLRESMETRGIDVLLSFTPENIFYLTGFQSPGYYAYQCLLVPAAREPVLVLRYLEETNVRSLSWITSCVWYDDNQDPVEATVSALRGLGAPPKVIGIEEDAWFLTVRRHRELAASLSGSKVVDASGIVEELRLRKSPQELHYIRQAAAACDAGMDRALSVAADAATEDDLALALYTGSIRHGSEYLSLPPFVAAGERSALAHATWSGRPLKTGDVVFLENCGTVHRYSAALTRCVSIGQPSDQARRMDEAARAGLAAAIEVAAPGVPAWDVDRACRGAIEALGFGDQFRHRTGYSIGIGFPPDWGEGHIMSIRSGESRPLEPGMVFHLVPTLFSPGEVAVGCSQPIAITDDGCERLSGIPEQLFIA